MWKWSWAVFYHTPPFCSCSSLRFLTSFKLCRTSDNIIQLFHFPLKLLLCIWFPPPPLFLPLLPLLHWISLSCFLYPLLHWLGSFFPFFFFILISRQFTLSICGLCLCTALGIKSDSLRDWMRVAMACCIWKAIHSAGTLRFNLKQDWCWQTSHPLSSKMFPPLPTSIADGQRPYATL